MAGLVINPEFWRDRKVFLTGHTGFKGAWAALLLRRLGAEVFGFSLPPENQDGLFVSANVAEITHHQVGDIRDYSFLQQALESSGAEIVLHMAAQSLVRPSYEAPVDTYATNVMGTVHLLESVKRNKTVKAAIIVTSDKCYENTGQLWGYRENESLGGHDPYSNSKACAELVTDSYRRSFFHESDTVIASARAGNVIGGGDWARDRIVPDAIRAFLAGKTLSIRNPAAVRPWQHVLDPVIAYLTLAERLVVEGKAFAEGWNFGPAAESEVPVSSIADRLTMLWGDGAGWSHLGGEHPHEAAYLRLDCSKAKARLGWRPLTDLDLSLKLTVSWYKAFQERRDIAAFTNAQIDTVLASAISH